MEVSGVLSGLMTLGGQEPYLLWLVVFGAAVFAVAGAESLRRQGAMRERLGVRPSSGDPTGERTLVYGETAWSWLRSLEPIYRPFTPSGAEVATDVRRRLTEAGWRNPNAVEVFFALRILLALALGVGAIVVLSLLFTKLKVLPLMALAIGAASVGYLLPGNVVTRRANTRKRLITEGFPDALDMLLVCVEAGLSLEAAIQRVGHEIRGAHPIISDEFQLVGNEMLAGKGRHDALRSLAVRTGVADVNGLASLLIQSDQFGTSIARALRVHAAEMRTTRILRAEERAHKIPVKLAFPLMFGLIPVVLIVTLAPGIIRVVEVLLPMMKSAGKLSH